MMNTLFSAATAAIAIAGLSAGTSSSTAAINAPGVAGKTQTGNALYLVHNGHEHIKGIGVVNSVNAAAHKVNLSHGPIAEVGWPAMTMDFDVAESVDLTGIAPGTKVEFKLDKGPDGMIQVQSLKPVTEGQ